MPGFVASTDFAPTDLEMSFAFSDLRVLVIDDNAPMRTILGEILHAAGLKNLSFAVDAPSGLQEVKTFRPDVCIVDHEMPGGNGLAFLAGARSDPEDRHLPIVMLTGHSDIRRLSAARDLGVTDFLAKPVTPRTLLTRLHAAVARPRPFIETLSYIGPDRRRRREPGYNGPGRRRDDQ